MTENRSLGAELVANEVWKQLGFETILRDCGFNDKEVALAAAVIWGRLIYPGSDLKTWRWLRESSALPDFQLLCVSESRVEKEHAMSQKKLRYHQRSACQFAGCYVIEHDGIDGNEEQLWRIYTTITKVEAAFRSMKTDLGTRPVYHQGAERTKGHLFLSILASHMLANIEHKLALSGKAAQWSTIREHLQTHQLSIIQWQDEKGTTHHKKISSKPEPHHLDVYRRLNVHNQLKDLK